MKRILLITGAVVWALSAKVGPSWAQAEPKAAPLYSLSRLSLDAGIGQRYADLSSGGLTGTAPATVARLEPTWTLFGKPGYPGAVSVYAPFEVTLNDQRQKDLGVFVLVTLLGRSEK